MEIIYYKNVSSTISLDKQLMQLGTGEIYAKYDIETIEPKIIIAYNQNITDTCNYVYIPELKRYYFAKDRVLTTGNRLKLWLRTDVLSSFKNDIRASSGIVERQQTLVNGYLHDSQFPILAYNNVVMRKFPKSFKKSNDIVLVACGGK